MEEETGPDAAAPAHLARGGGGYGPRRVRADDGARSCAREVWIKKDPSGTHIGKHRLLHANPSVILPAWATRFQHQFPGHPIATLISKQQRWQYIEIYTHWFVLRFHILAARSMKFR